MNALVKFMKILGVLCVVLLLFFLGRNANKCEVLPPVIHIDTNIFINPPPIELSLGDISINDSIIIHDNFTIKDDSLVVLPIETKNYKGPSYELQITGARFNLDWVKTYDKTITKTVIDYPRRYHEVSFEGSLGYHNAFVTPITVNYQYNMRYLSVKAGIGYDPFNESAIIITGIKIPIYRWNH